METLKDKLNFLLTGWEARQWSDEERLEKMIWEIADYIDENAPCKHKSAYQVEGIGDVYYNVCNDCGVLFLAEK